MSLTIIENCRVDCHFKKSFRNFSHKNDHMVLTLAYLTKCIIYKFFFNSIKIFEKFNKYLLKNCIEFVDIVMFTQKTEFVVIVLEFFFER